MHLKLEQRQLKNIFSNITVAYVIIGLMFLGMCFTLYQQLSDSAFDTSTVDAAQQRAFEPMLISAATLTDWNLFGVQPNEDVSLPETTLSLSLIGLFQSGQNQTSSAIIQSNSGPARVYHEGDTISDGVIIIQIDEDQVILSREGIHESLVLPRFNP